MVVGWGFVLIGNKKKIKPVKAGTAYREREGCSEGLEPHMADN